MLVRHVLAIAIHGWGYSTAGSTQIYALTIFLHAGCGTGNYLVALSNYVGQVTGVDYNGGMLEQARTKTSTLQNVTVQQGDATNLPFPGQQMDGIVCNQVMYAAAVDMFVSGVCLAEPFIRSSLDSVYTPPTQHPITITMLLLYPTPHTHSPPPPPPPPPLHARTRPPTQVLHHIQLPGSEGYGGVKKFVQEAYRVLKPGGVLVVNTCTEEQLMGTVFKHIIPAAVARVSKK